MFSSASIRPNVDSVWSTTACADGPDPNRIENERCGASDPHLCRGLLQVGAIACRQCHAGEVACESRSGRLADALAGACNKGN
jgi:hypothetical protein